MASLPFTTRLEGIQEAVQTYSKEINRFKRNIETWTSQIEHMERKSIMSSTSQMSQLS